MLQDVIQRTSLNQSDDILNAIDNSADCNVHGDVGVESIVPYSGKTNQCVTQKDNSNSPKDMLNAIHETRHCQDECNGHGVNTNVSFAEIETKNSDPMCDTKQVSMIIGSDLHETAAINVASNNACVLSSTTKNNHFAVGISACVASINNDELNDDSQCSGNCTVNDFKLCCIVETSTSSSCHSDTSMDMEADVPINLSTPKLQVADEEDKYNRNLPLDFSFQHDIPKSVLNHAPSITGKPLNKQSSSECEHQQSFESVQFSTDDEEKSGLTPDSKEHVIGTITSIDSLSDVGNVSGRPVSRIQCEGVRRKRSPRWPIKQRKQMATTKSNQKKKRGHSGISRTKHPASWMFGKETFYIPELIAVNQFSVSFKC